MKEAIRVLYWFRTDLRLHSSPALHAALNLEPDVLYPIWTWDPEYVYAHKVGINRFNFLLESMRDLSGSLTALNPESKLLVVRGSPVKVLPVLFKEWKISHLVYEKDTAGYAASRDRTVVGLAAEAGVHVLSVLGHTLYDPEEVVKSAGGKATVSLSSWHAAVKTLPSPLRPLPVPKTIPSPGDTAISRKVVSGISPSSDVFDLNSEDRVSQVTCFDEFSGPTGDFSVPSLEELGLPPATTSIRGGESEALRRLDRFCSNQEALASFSKPKTSPAAFDPPSTSLLSPYLKFGCLGINELYWRVRDEIEAYKKPTRGKSVTQEPENFEGQLFFREMYYAAECAQGQTFGQIHGNSVSRFIDWHLQNEYHPDGTKVLPRPAGDSTAEEWFLAWKEGRTGFPWIDAIMRQLRQEGWIHHLARHSVACFLTRGQCYISWERGAEVFDDYLLDWDPCSNPGNWMWLSASAFYNMYYRVYGLKSFPMKYDKQGKFVRKFCPELAKFPDKYIYSPHLASLSIQKEAGCIIGKDYPHPMLDEAVEKERCQLRMKIAFGKKFHGDDKEVLNGAAGDVLHEAFKEALSERDDDKNNKKRKQGDKSGDKSVAAGGSGSKTGAGSMDRYLTKRQKVQKAGKCQ